MIGITMPRLKRYFIYKLFLSFKVKIKETIIIKKGFTNSIGWNLGKKGRSNHLADPLTSMPMKGIKAKVTKDTKKSILDIFKSFFWSINEKDIIIDIPKKIKNKCFVKK